MKKCPTCQKTFDDNLRFCQADGTPLVDDVPPVDDTPAFDPYATIVSPGGFSEAIPAGSPDGEADEPTNLSSSAIPIDEPEDILEVPMSDPLKTMYASDAEMKEILGAGIDEAGGGSPDGVETSAPEPPFAQPEAGGFGNAAPPPSPFSASSGDSIELEPVAPPAEPTPQSAPEPAFDEAATIIQPPMSAALPAEPPAPMEQWAPPPAPEPSWQNQPIGSETPFQTPPVGVAASGDNKTLPIVSLILGIVSLCCYVSPITGLAALITGFMALNNIKNDPNAYGGKGLAIAGMITGGIFFLVGVAYYIFVILVYAGMITGSMLQGR